MRKVLIIGDVHGKVGKYFDLLDDFVERHKHTDGELRSLQLGDFGFGEHYKRRARWFDRVSRYNIEDHVFFGGNHDQYPIPEWTCHLEHFGEVPFIPDSFFARGARSIDKESRTVGHDWWAEEELGWDQSRKALSEYIETRPTYMFSHDCPSLVAEKMFPEKENYNTHTGNLLEEMFKEHKPKVWTFGHWHETKHMTIDGTEFTCLGELETFEMEFLSHEEQ